MNCQNCGIETRPNNQYCHNCGTPLELVDVSKGSNFIRIAFVFVAIFPALQSVFGLIIAIYFKKIFPLQFLDIFIVTTLFIFFALIYRGKLWAIIPIGIFIVFSGFLNLVLAFFTYSTDALYLRRAIFGILYIGFGFYFIKSKDVLAFVKNKSINASYRLTAMSRDKK